jgi:integrase
MIDLPRSNHIMILSQSLGFRCRVVRQPWVVQSTQCGYGRSSRYWDYDIKGLGLELEAHPHMLRHPCGYALANRGHDTRAIQGWLGHRSITSTAVYTALAPNRFKDFWRD